MLLEAPSVNLQQEVVQSAKQSVSVIQSCYSRRIIVGILQFP